MSDKRLVYAAALALIAGSADLQAPADTISSPFGLFSVGVAPNGELYDESSNTGFRRNADRYDPIDPYVPRDSWGVSAGSVSGWADHRYQSVVNVVGNGGPVFGPNSGFISSFLRTGSANLLRIDQAYGFAAENVLRIETVVANVSASAQSVLFSRDVDWDVSPTVLSERITVDPYALPVLSASYYGFEHPNPLVPFGYPAVAAGGIFGPLDYGGGFKLDLGMLGVGGTTSFNVFYAINEVTSSIHQSEDELRTQLVSLGADFVITGRNSDYDQPNHYVGYLNSAALGVDFRSPPVPEPSALAALLGLAVTGLIAFWISSRLANRNRPKCVEEAFRQP